MGLAARGGLSQVPALVARYLHSQSVRSEPLEQEHLECWLRNARAVGESRARRHTGPCQGSDHAIPHSIQLGQEQTSALSLPIRVRFPLGAEHCHGQVLAGHSHFTGRSKPMEGGRDPPVSPGSARVDCAGAGHPPGMFLLSQAVFSVLQIGKNCLRSLKQSKIHHGFPFLLLSQSESPR